MICNPLFGILISASPLIFLLFDAVDATSIVPNWASSPPDTLEPPAAPHGLGLLWVSEQYPPTTVTLGERCDLGVAAVLDKKLLIAVGLDHQRFEVSRLPNGLPQVAFDVPGHRCEDDKMSGQSKKKKSNYGYLKPVENKNRKQSFNQPIARTN